MADAQTASVRMAQTATETSRTVQRSNEQSATSYQQLAQQAQRSQSQAETAQTRARTAVENRTTAEQNMRTVLERVGATESERAAAARRYETATDQATRAQERARDATRDYQRAQERADRATQQFGDSARDAEREVRQLGEASDDAAESSRGIGEGVRERMEGAFSGVGEIAGRSGSSGGGNFLSEFSGKISGLAGKGGPIAAALVGVAAVGLAAGAILANAIADGMEREKQEDLIQAKLGVNEETARRIGEAAGLAYSNAWGDSIAGNMDGARAAIQSGLLTGEEDTKTFQSTIEQLNVVAELMGEDIPAVARAAGQSVKNGIANDATGAFDLLVKSQQNSLNVSEDLLDSQIEYSTQLRAMGLEGEEGWALVAQGVKGGARDTDVVIDALKEMKLRATDGTAAAADGFEKLSLNSDLWTTAMNEGGEASRNAMADALRGLNAITDPTEKNAAALALFGTKFEDIQGAAFALNLDTAVAQFGEVEGAAANAGNTMSGNTASSFESAKRSIETSSNDIKLALAQAFGPALTDVANWVTTHKPELIAFFTGLASAALTTGIGIAQFSADALRVMANLSEGTGKALGFMVGGMGEVVGVAGSLARALGMDGVADKLEGVGDAMKGFQDATEHGADTMRGMADSIDSAIPSLENVRDGVVDAGERAETSARLMQALGTAVVEDIPDEKSIIIDSNTPEQTEALKALGLKVEELPDGTFKVTSNTDEGQRAIDAFIGNNSGKSIDMFVELEQRRIGYWESRGVSSEDAPSMQGPVPVIGDGNSMGGGGGHFADGGIREAHDPQIGDGRVTRIWNEPETEGESYIPHAASKRSRAEDILGITARKFGFGLVKSFAEGGVIGKDGLDASMSWAQSMDPATYGMGGFSTSVIDCSGAVSGAINKALGLDAFDSRMSTVTEGSWLQARGAILGKGPEGTVRVGWWDEGGGANGHTAMTYPDGTNFESNGSEGVVVGGKTGFDDPSFTDHAWFPMSGDLGAASDTGAGFNAENDPDGSKAFAAGDFTERYRQAYGVEEDQVSSGTTTSGVGLSTDGSRVYVTNWPSTLGGSDKPKEEERKPILTAGLKVFANGGVEDHTAQIGNGVTRMWNEPETGGEGYIPLSPSKRPRSVAVTKAIANRFGYQLVPMADGGLTGFGGYQDSDRPTLDIPLNGQGMSANKQRASLNNLLALGVGGLNTLASGFDGNGNFTGKFDTGSNSPAVLEEGLGQLLGKFDELIDAAKNGKPIDVQVDIDQGNRSANIAIMEAGL